MLWSFAGADGAHPYTELLADKAGVLYGTTDAGGASGLGTVFSLAPPASGTAWSESVLWSFAGPDGAVPLGGLVRRAGSLYGTTQNGGTAGQGAVYRLDPPVAGATGWHESAVWSFSGATDGRSPWATLTKSGGALLGSTEYGGAYGYGTLFRLLP